MRARSEFVPLLLSPTPTRANADGAPQGFDEFMNRVIDDAVEVKQITKTNDTESRRPLGTMPPQPFHISGRELTVCRANPTQGGQRIADPEPILIGDCMNKDWTSWGGWGYCGIYTLDVVRPRADDAGGGRGREEGRSRPTEGRPDPLPSA
ncbi:hypothetical protein IMZ48_17315 [Candidatus Bathyarchaeota archaeon]|nr:hypothetical protein [Candidatus Bathyarchaeota archaeon]